MTTKSTQEVERRIDRLEQKITLVVGIGIGVAWAASIALGIAMVISTLR